jgi:hypothetical protein
LPSALLRRGLPILDFAIGFAPASNESDAKSFSSRTLYFLLRRWWPRERLSNIWNNRIQYPFGMTVFVDGDGGN